MNNYRVPEYEMEDEETIPSSSGLSRQKKSALGGDELVELLWQNGQVVMHSQSQRFTKKSPAKFPTEDAIIPAGGLRPMETRPATATSPAAEEEAPKNLFMQEDEMASWLHYSLDDSFERDFCADLLYPTPSFSNYAAYGRNSQIPEDRRPEDKTPVDQRPPIPPNRYAELEYSPAKLHNFSHFSRSKAKCQPGPSISDKAARTSTVVDSSDTPAIQIGSRVCNRSANTPLIAGKSTDSGGYGVRETVPCEPTMTSSSGNSGASAEPLGKAPAGDRKRKAREADANECHSEDVDCGSIDGKKHLRGSTSTRRSRAAEVHNLSERRRRDRINEKMKALQELIPRCNKSDKASMLDEAIEYLKSLQLQVQMMSMGCGMVPMMFPGVQQYMSPMAMRMGVGMGMDMGLSRPMMPFPSVLTGSAMQPSHAGAAHLGPRLPLPAFHLPPVSPVDLSRISDPALNSNAMQNHNQMQIPNFGDHYQHYLSLQQLQVSHQNQAMTQPNTIKGLETPENHQPG